MSESIRIAIDKFYQEHGPCCAGCDWWRFYNSVVGECTKSAPISGEERYSMIGIERLSMESEPGHIITVRGHVCGDFKDDFDWSRMPG